jgi:small subunit ribosomal protein S16
MVKLRLARFGAKKRPFYRIVAMDSQGKRDGRYIEQLGTYDPMQDPPAVTLNEERVRYWLSVGAQPTEAVDRLVKKMAPAA